MRLGPYFRLVEDDRTTRRTLADAVAVLRSIPTFTEASVVQIRVAPLRLPSGQIVGLVDVEFRCSPEWEHRTFDTNERWPWWAVVRAKAPTVVLLAEHGSSCPRSARIALRILKQSWHLKIIPNTSHLLPMEAPDSVYEAVMDAVEATV